MSKCSECAHSHKIEDADYDKIYSCDAEVYDIYNLTCFVPKDLAGTGVKLSLSTYDGCFL